MSRKRKRNSKEVDENGEIIKNISKKRRKLGPTKPKFTLLNCGFRGSAPKKKLKLNKNYVDIFKTKRKFNLILADPPWEYSKYVSPTQQGQARKFYNTMSLEDLKKLPIPDICQEKCILLLWVTCTLMDQGFELINSWGFKYVTVFLDWHKTNSKTSGILRRRGLGKYGLITSEYILLSQKGEALSDVMYVPPMITYNNNVQICDDHYLLLARKGSIVDFRDVVNKKVFPNVLHSSMTLRKKTLLEAVTVHSKKPIQAYERIERVFTHAKTRIELFARGNRKGWSTWGNEVEHV